MLLTYQQTTATTHWQSTMPAIWREQLDDPKKGGRYLDKEARCAMRQSLDRGDFQISSDTAFLQLNRNHALSNGARWRAVPTSMMFCNVSASQKYNEVSDYIKFKNLHVLSADDASRIISQFPQGHVYAMESDTDKIPKDLLIDTFHNNLSQLGVRLMIADKSCVTTLIPSLSLLSTIYTTLFPDSALLPIAISGGVNRMQLHDLHIEGKRGVGLVFDRSTDNGVSRHPTYFAWHDLFHGLQGMISGDFRIFRLTHHFAAAIEFITQTANASHPGFYLSCAGKSYYIRESLHDFVFSRYQVRLNSQSSPSYLLIDFMREFLDKGEFEVKTNSGNQLWFTFLRDLEFRIRSDVALTADSEAIKLLSAIENSKPNQK